MGVSVLQKSAATSRRRRRHTTSAVMSEINVTPFVDVMLVLLIIFMVAAPLLTVGVPIALPKTAADSLPAAESEPLTVTVTADGLLLVQNTEVAETEFLPRLTAIAEARGDNKVYLRADGAVAYEVVVQVMGALNASGFSDIGLITDSGGPRFDGSGG